MNPQTFSLALTAGFFGLACSSTLPPAESAPGASNLPSKDRLISAIADAERAANDPDLDVHEAYLSLMKLAAGGQEPDSGNFMWPYDPRMEKNLRGTSLHPLLSADQAKRAALAQKKLYLRTVRLMSEKGIDWLEKCQKAEKPFQEVFIPIVNVIRTAKKNPCSETSLRLLASMASYLNRATGETHEKTEDVDAFCWVTVQVGGYDGLLNVIRGVDRFLGGSPRSCARTLKVDDIQIP